MEENLITKKELLEITGISYGALYRWKRMKLLPDDCSSIAPPLPVTRRFSQEIRCWPGGGDPETQRNHESGRNRPAVPAGPAGRGFP